MLNTLANHGYLPHDGKDITRNRTACALNTALNISVEFGKFLFDFAVMTNPTPNATTFSLDHLIRHNILEHDASLSRADFYFGGDAHSFNQTVFDETRSYWKGPIINLQMAADSRLARLITSNATNPNYTLSDLGSTFSIGETAAYILMLGNPKSGTVRKALVEYLFENERLPTKLGWVPSPTAIGQSDLSSMMERVVNKTGVTPEEAAKILKRADLHSGQAFV
ncbi:Cloroperoxidase [Lojkania enalia]|uniref:Cloroperoxidase n=1 Tax=Lojkania enalia TaxID=147567 RepID=A0A9P4K7S3_9PLEO|nr:Cloroperoxidase [Didymosphaeria enalia]